VQNQHTTPSTTGSRILNNRNATPQVQVASL
jgi:hypothetical protein